MSDLFVEVVVAPSFHDEALAVFAAKKNLRVVELPVEPRRAGSLDYKRVRGGFLVQDRFQFDPSEDGLDGGRPTAQPTERGVERPALRLGRRARRSSRTPSCSRATRRRSASAPGQMSRVDASFLAVHKARQQGHDPRGRVLASDGFFPFPDGVEEAAAAGVTAIIQPGGSVRDAEVIAAANRLGHGDGHHRPRQFRH